MTADGKPQFHNDPGAEVIGIGVKEFVCIGARPPFDHPHVSLTLDPEGDAICPYCSTVFKYDETLSSGSANPMECMWTGAEQTEARPVVAPGAIDAGNAMLAEEPSESNITERQRQFWFFANLIFSGLTLLFIWVLFEHYLPLNNDTFGTTLRNIRFTLISVCIIVILVMLWRTPNKLRNVPRVMYGTAYVIFPAGLAIWWFHFGVPPNFTYAALVPLLVVVGGCLLMAFRVVKCKCCIFLIWTVASLVAFAAPVIVTFFEGKSAFAQLAVVENIESAISCAKKALFVHISDLHLLARDTDLTADREAAGNQRFKQLLPAILDASPEYILVSGDITDHGRADEWGRASEIFKSIPASSRIILAPGNHDLNRFFDDASKTDRALQFLQVQATLFPEIKSASGATLQSRLANEPREPVVDPAKELEEYQNFMKFCTSMPNFHLDPLGRSGPRDPISETRAKELECGGGYVLNKEQKHNEFLSEVAKYRSDVADGVFPLYWKDKKNGIAIFSLMFDSVSERASLGRNAIGAMSVNQKDRLIKLLKGLRPEIKTVLIVQHFPIARGPGDTMAPPDWRLPEFELGKWVRDLENSQWWSYALLRAEPDSSNALLSELQEQAHSHPDRQYLILFGHRHRRSFGRLGMMTMVEAPNVGTVIPENWGFFQAASGPGPVAVSWCGFHPETP